MLLCLENDTFNYSKSKINLENIFKGKLKPCGPWTIAT